MAPLSLSRRRALLALASLPLLPACRSAALPTLALVNGTLIDGSGADPVPDAVVVVQGETILAAGPREAVRIPPGAQTIDVAGATVLPGLINAHVHGAFDAGRLKAWAAAGVTTVRDAGLFSGRDIAGNLRRRETIFHKPEYARIVSAGVMISVPGGYGNHYVESVEEALRFVEEELDAGVEVVKISREDGYAGTSGLPKMPDEIVAAVVALAHERGALVSAHITQARFLEEMVALGVDDIAHTPYDFLSDAAIAEMVRRDVTMNTTFSVLNSYNALGYSLDNLGRFVQAGGRAVMGNDYLGGRDLEDFELGLPLYEFEKMAEAGLPPMQILLTATKHAAAACNQLAEIGTVEPGKSADLLVVDGDPLEEIRALQAVRMVMRSGVVIATQGYTSYTS